MKLLIRGLRGWIDRHVGSHLERQLASARGEVDGQSPALLDRIREARGSVHAEIKEMPERKLRVAFAKDPEGNLTEIVQMVE